MAIAGMFFMGLFGGTILFSIIRAVRGRYAVILGLALGIALGIPLQLISQRVGQTGLLQLAAFSFRTIKSWSGFAGDF
jgi:hypothetical protein